MTALDAIRGLFVYRIRCDAGALCAGFAFRTPARGRSCMRGDPRVDRRPLAAWTAGEGLPCMRADASSMRVLAIVSRSKALQRATWYEVARFAIRGRVRHSSASGSVSPAQAHALELCGLCGDTQRNLRLTFAAAKGQKRFLSWAFFAI